MKLYTIGFTHKRARLSLNCCGATAFSGWWIFASAGRAVVGLCAQDDLPYSSIGWRKAALSASAGTGPTKDILKDYRADGDWDRSRAAL